MKTKPVLHLAGSVNGAPTLEQLIAMTKKITGRDPTPEEIEAARKMLDSE